MNSNVPLVRSNSVNDINTSIIAIKKELGKNGDPITNVNVEVNYPDACNPVDSVIDGDMHAITSNAVFDRLNDFGFCAETSTANSCLANETLGTLNLVKGFYLMIYSSGFVTDDGATMFSLTDGTGALHGNTVIQQKYWRAQQVCYAEITSNTANVNIISVTDYTANENGTLLAIRLR